MRPYRRRGKTCTTAVEGVTFDNRRQRSAPLQRSSNVISFELRESSRINFFPFSVSESETHDGQKPWNVDGTQIAIRADSESAEMAFRSSRPTTHVRV
jgi:hypothetical protein